MWDIWRSSYNILESIFYLLKGDYIVIKSVYNVFYVMVRSVNATTGGGGGCRIRGKGTQNSRHVGTATLRGL